MTERFEPKEELERLPDIIVGEPLPGLVSDYSQLPEGVNYEDQVVLSKYGNLSYLSVQLRNGQVWWSTLDDPKKTATATATVESGSGIVVGLTVIE